MTELSNAFVCIMGMGTVFTGLICIVLICVVLSKVMKLVGANAKSESTPAPKKEATSVAPAVNLAPAEKAAAIAGICACIAHELGTEASNIKVLSFKRV